MTASPRENKHVDVISLRFPFRIVRSGGRKETQLPDGAVNPSRSDNTLVKALARTFRWKRLLEPSKFSSAGDLAEREGIAPSYVTRILQLTLLASDTVEEILDGKQRQEMTQARLLETVSYPWA